MTLKTFPLLSLAALVLGGCATATALSALPAGGRSASVHVGTLPYGTLALHRWVAADVFEYDVTLLVKQGEDFVPLQPPVSAVLPQTGAQATSTTRFGGLSARVYQARVTARGSLAAADASATLNATPATVTFDLTAAQDRTGTATVTLDAVPFDVTATSAITPPATDGQWVAPAATASIQVDSPN